MSRRRLSQDPMIGRLVAWSRVNEIKCQAVAARNGIDIFGPIGDFPWEENAITGAEVAQALDLLSPDRDVEVRISSPGGEVWDGVAIYNLFKSAPQKIHVKVIGVAASIASIISMAGDTIEMGTGTTMMIHKAWALTLGNEIELRETADTLAGIDTNLVDIYHMRTGINRDEISSMMHPDTHMSAAKAVQLGFADSVSDPTIEASATIQPTALSRFFLGSR